MDDYYTCDYERIAEAAKNLNLLEESTLKQVLVSIAQEIEAKSFYILSENDKDLRLMDEDSSRYVVCSLTEESVKYIAANIRSISSEETPVGKVIETLDLGEKVTGVKISIPAGVIGVINESKPNLILEVFAKCIKTRNACIYRGARDAKYTNAAIVDIIRRVLDHFNINPNICTLLPYDMEAIDELLGEKRYVNMVITHAGEDLATYVERTLSGESLLDASGFEHVYIHRSANPERACKIISAINQSGISNVFGLLIDREYIDKLSKLFDGLDITNRTIFADKPAYEQLKDIYPNIVRKRSVLNQTDITSGESRILIDTVSNVEETVEYLSESSSRCYEAIVSEDEENIKIFKRTVDAAILCINAEISMCRDLLHKESTEERNRMKSLFTQDILPLEDLCKYKWIVEAL